MIKNNNLSTQKIIKELCPPILWNALKVIKQIYFKLFHNISRYQKISPDQQDLGIYWDQDMAQMLDTWGIGNVWSEIQFLMVNCCGKILDIACGTGKTIELLRNYPNLDLYGCDISDFLINKALERGITSDHLMVCNAIKTNYSDIFSKMPILSALWNTLLTKILYYF
jgi:SAM-dependent methyltransferase